MRIAIVTEAWEPQVNGVVRTYQNIKRELEKAAHDVRIVAPDHFRVNFPLPSYPDIKMCAPLPGETGRILRRHDPDHIHIATEGALGWSARAYCRRNGIGFTTAYHTNFADYLRERLFLPGRLRDAFHAAAIHAIVRFHNASAGVMCVSEEVDAQLRAMGVTAPFRRLSRGVDTALFHPGPREVFADDPRPVALYVGRVAVEKNIRAFLDLAIPHLKVVVGGGPQLDDLRRAYPDVRFAGMKEGAELAAYYRSADVFVFPSKTDTFGIVLIEALASGLPIAAFDEGGHTAILSGDPRLGAADSSLSCAFARACEAPGTREERHRYVQARYSWESVGGQFVANCRL